MSRELDEPMMAQTQTENGEPGGQKECHLERLVIQYARTFVLLGEAPVQLAEGKTIMSPVESFRAAECRAVLNAPIDLRRREFRR